MDLWEFYGEVEDLIVDLRDSGDAATADAIEAALRGGSTSGEILGALVVALPQAANIRPRALILTDWATAALA